MMALHCPKLWPISNVFNAYVSSCFQQQVLEWKCNKHDTGSSTNSFLILEICLKMHDGSIDTARSKGQLSLTILLFICILTSGFIGGHAWYCIVSTWSLPFICGESMPMMTLDNDAIVLVHFESVWMISLTSLESTQSEWHFHKHSWSAGCGFQHLGELYDQLSLPNGGFYTGNCMAPLLV